MDQVGPQPPQPPGARDPGAQPIPAAPRPVFEKQGRLVHAHLHLPCAQVLRPGSKTGKAPQRQHAVIAARAQHLRLLRHAQLHAAQLARITADDDARQAFSTSAPGFMEEAAQPGAFPLAQEQLGPVAPQPGPHGAERLAHVSAQHPARHAQQLHAGREGRQPALAPAKQHGAAQYPGALHLRGTDDVRHPGLRTEPGRIAGRMHFQVEPGFAAHGVIAPLRADAFVIAGARLEDAAAYRHVGAPHQARIDGGVAQIGAGNAPRQADRRQAQQPVGRLFAPGGHDGAAEQRVAGVLTRTALQAAQPVGCGHGVVVAKDEQLAAIAV